MSLLQLLAPLTGPVVPLEQVPDPVFSQKLMGDGVAIDPTNSTLVAPCDGVIEQLHPAGHATSITHASGAQILLHIGIDTVKLKGRGFTPRVKVGDRVRAGQTLIEFDADLLAREARSLLSLMIVTEAQGQSITHAQLQGSATAQDVLLTLGEAAASASVAGASGAASAAGGATPVSAGSSAASAAGSAAEFRSAKIAVKLATGIHARPAALIAARAKNFGAQIELRKASGAKGANAKSVVALLGLNVEAQEEVYFVARGDDGERAVAELAKFLAELREDESAPAPRKPSEAPRAADAPKASVKVIVGIAASPGLALGRVRQIRAQKFQVRQEGEGVAAEKAKLFDALSRARAELETLQRQVSAQSDAHRGAIFAAHRELLDDPDLVDASLREMQGNKSAAYAWQRATSDVAERLAGLNNELLANRANDLRDVGQRVLRLLVGTPEVEIDSSQLESDTILIAENLTPSDTAKLDRARVRGFCTTTGGAASHVAILARSMGLPAVAGVEARALQIAEGTEVLIDGDRGELRLEPSEEEKVRVRQQQARQLETRRAALSQAQGPASTTDGRHIEVGANIGGVADAQQAVQMGCDGVGLLRSEFLFLNRATPPTEEEQFQIYQEIADVLGDRPLTIRTLDVGGDKPLPYLPLPPEENPFLGVRGIRVGLRDPALLREQLRAILRVRGARPLNVMFPMITTIDEFRAAKAILEEERESLAKSSGRRTEVKVGIMIEVPAAALAADIFAREVDFFSIGTNDLTQYTLAMDRGHNELAKQVDGLHPSVLKLIQMTAAAGRAAGKWTGVCGGIAGDEAAVPLLIGLGVEELSVSVPVIPLIKAQVRGSSERDSKVLAERALTQESGAAVRALRIAPTSGSPVSTKLFADSR